MMDKDFRKASHVKKNKTNQADKVCYFEKKIFIFKKIKLHTIATTLHTYIDGNNIFLDSI